MKIVQALEDSNILLKGVTKTIKNEKKTKTNRGILKNVVGLLTDGGESKKAPPP